MATTGKRLVLDGRPSIPAAMDLPATRAAVDQIRTRLEKIDAAVNRAFTTLDATSPQKALESLQRQIAVLSKDLENLTSQVESAAGLSQPTYLAMQTGDDGEDGAVGPPGPAGRQGERGYTLLLDQDASEDLPLGFTAPPLPIQGTVTLVAGAAVVANTSVTATSRIMLTPQNASGVAGSVSVTARTAGTSFTIESTNALDTRDIAYVLFA